MTSAVYVQYVLQQGNIGYYSGEHLIYASDVPGVHANNGYHAGALSGRHTGFYPGNAAVAPPPAPFYPAANNAGGVPFTASPIMPEGRSLVAYWYGTGIVAVVVVVHVFFTGGFEAAGYSWNEG